MRRLLRAWWHLFVVGCAGHVQHDETGLWFECSSCHRRSAFASWDALWNADNG